MNFKRKDPTVSYMNTLRDQALPTVEAAARTRRDMADSAFVRLEELAIVFSSVRTALGDSSALWKSPLKHHIYDDV